MMETTEETKAAVDELNLSSVKVDSEKSYQLTVLEFVSRIDRNGAGRPKLSNNLYVKNFPDPGYTEE
jgi:hypothetical protein